MIAAVLVADVIWRQLWCLGCYHNPHYSKHHSSGSCVPFSHTSYCGKKGPWTPMKPFWKQFCRRFSKVKGLRLRLIWSAVTSPVILGNKSQTLLISRKSHGTQSRFSSSTVNRLRNRRYFSGSEEHEQMNKLSECCIVFVIDACWLLRPWNFIT